MFIYNKKGKHAFGNAVGHRNAVAHSAPALSRGEALVPFALAEECLKR